ncbi:MAG: DUF1318 domain-containing protein [Bdellovibrionia bacterium]
MKKKTQKKTSYPLIASLQTCLAFNFSPVVVLSIATATVLTQTACVTVNVNFPENAVQKATDDYVRDLYRAKEKGKAPGSEQGTAPTSKLTSFFSSILIESAYADDFKVQSAKADEIKARLKSRLDDLISQKRSGNVGESNDGRLVVKATGLPPLLMKKVKTLVDEDNSDRMDLYKEVATLNGLGSSGVSTVQKSFARSFQSLSPSGTWVQDSDGNWTKKP